MLDFWTILTAILVATSSAILGSFLIMRKMAMVGDAISHAVLPGIVIAYWLTQSRASFPILIGAAASGLLVTAFIQFFNKKVKLQQDASIGISYTFLFSIGIILISVFSNDVDLDQDCVLHGDIAQVSQGAELIVGQLSLGPNQVWILAANLVLVVLAVVLAYHKLIITTFDESFAAALGLNVVLWQYYLMAGVSITTVVSFQSVGAVLVIAFLVGPPATAYLITTRFRDLLMYAIIFGTSASVFGYYFAVWIDGSIAGAIAAVIGLQFAVVFAIVRFKKRAGEVTTPEKLPIS
ncbi:MAG: metal ABC transporter permease [Flavobacteriales bacterium]|nr:metal ABC transporter permease [Flavobacteriales bacterium]